METEKGKDEEVINRLVLQRIMELINMAGGLHYEPLDPEWEGLIMGGDEPKDQLEGKIRDWDSVL